MLTRWQTASLNSQAAIPILFWNWDSTVPKKPSFHHNEMHSDIKYGSRETLPWPFLNLFQSPAAGPLAPEATVEPCTLIVPPPGKAGRKSTTIKPATSHHHHHPRLRIFSSFLETEEPRRGSPLHCLFPLVPLALLHFCLHSFYLELLPAPRAFVHALLHPTWPLFLACQPSLAELSGTTSFTHGLPLSRRLKGLPPPIRV